MQKFLLGSKRSVKYKQTTFRTDAIKHREGNVMKVAWPVVAQVLFTGEERPRCVVGRKLYLLRVKTQEN